ncbi:MAG: amino acid ABC transporter substrate-binding protein [Geminicoccaceae bacterium]
MRTLNTIAAGAAAITLLAPNAEAGQTYDAVKEKGFVQCGVADAGIPGFATVDAQNNWSGLDIDLCRAVAAAVFGDSQKVKFTPLSAKERFTALQSGEIDVLSRNTTESLLRDTALGLDFPAVNYYDGQGFMVKKSLGVKSATELGGATICVQAGTLTELTLADFAHSHGIKYNLVVFENNDEVNKAYEAGRCDVLTTDQSALYAARVKLDSPDDHVVLPEVVTKEPLGPAVRHGDNEWGDVVRWSYYAMVQGEEFGLTSANIDEMRASTQNPDVKRFLGDTDELGKAIGLPNDFAYQIVKQVGNYGDSFERNVGDGSPLKIARGINALWENGGLQYSPPFR